MSQESNPFQPPSAPVEAKRGPAPVELKRIKVFALTALTSTVATPLLLILIFRVSHDFVGIVFIATIITTIIAIKSSLTIIFNHFQSKWNKKLYNTIILIIVGALVGAIFYPALFGGRR